MLIFVHGTNNLMPIFSLLLMLWLLPATERWQDQPAPSTAPALALPALVAGSAESPSFVVSGIARPENGGELGFYVASDGKRQLCALYDIRDGVPILLSDGQRTLIYDVQGKRLIHLPSSRAFVSVDWEGGAEKPVEFAFGAKAYTEPQPNAKLNELPNSAFRLDRYVADRWASLRRQEPAADTIVYIEETAESLRRVEISRAAPTAFRFTHRERDAKSTALELDARSVGEPIAPSAVTFPDLKLLGENLAIIEAEELGRAGVVRAVGSGRIWATKLALVMGPSVQADLASPLGNPNWEELAAQDEEFGSRYREALAAQGISLSPAGADSGSEKAKE